MQAVLSFLPVLLLSAIVLTLVHASLAKDGSIRRKRQRRAFFLVFALLADTLIEPVLSDEVAKRAGFGGAADRADAERFGITDPLIWRTQKLEQAQRDAAEAEKIRSAEAAREAAELKNELESAARAKEMLVAEEKLASEVAKKERDRCRQDLHCWGEEGYVGALVRCPAFIQKQAQWDYEWTDTMYEPKLVNYSWQDQKLGIVRYFGDKIKLQDSFGGWKTATYTCDVDPETNHVLDVALH